MSTDLSVVIPVFNEHQSIKTLYEELIDALKEKKSYEIVFVDDGSTDSTFEELKALSEKNSKVKVVKLLNNFGQSNAIAAGIKRSNGDVVVTMDSDLQHDPKDILPLAEKTKEGYQVVCGWRKARTKSDAFFIKVIPSKISNALIRMMTGLKLNDTTGGMRAFTRKVVETIPLYGEMHRYLPIIAHWRGFKITEHPITIRKRSYGTTKYNYKRLFRGFMDLVTIRFFIKFTKRPTHLFYLVGTLSFFIGFVIGLYYVILNFLIDISLVQNLASLLLAVILVLMGVMFLGFGFIIDMISYDAISSQKRETYIVDEVLNEKQ